MRIRRSVPGRRRAEFRPRRRRISRVASFRRDARAKTRDARAPRRVRALGPGTSRRARRAATNALSRGGGGRARSLRFPNRQTTTIRTTTDRVVARRRARRRAPRDEIARRLVRRRRGGTRRHSSRRTQGLDLLVRRFSRDVALARHRRAERVHIRRERFARSPLRRDVRVTETKTETVTVTETVRGPGRY